MLQVLWYIHSQLGEEGSSGALCREQFLAVHYAMENLE